MGTVFRAATCIRRLVRRQDAHADGAKEPDTYNAFANEAAVVARLCIPTSSSCGSFAAAKTAGRFW